MSFKCQCLFFPFSETQKVYEKRILETSTKYAKLLVRNKLSENHCYCIIVAQGPPLAFITIIFYDALPYTKNPIVLLTTAQLIPRGSLSFKILIYLSLTICFSRHYYAGKICCCFFKFVFEPGCFLIFNAFL